MSYPATLIRAAHNLRAPPRVADEDPAAYELRLRAHCRRLRADLEREGAYHVGFSPDGAEGPANAERPECIRCIIMAPMQIFPEGSSDGEFECIHLSSIIWSLRRVVPFEPMYAEDRFRPDGEFVWGRSFPRCLCQGNCSCKGGHCACAGADGCLCDGLFSVDHYDGRRRSIFGYGRSAESWPGAAAGCESTA